MTSELRHIRGLNMAGVEPGGGDANPPRFEWVDPSTLLVDGAYQRNLSERSVKLIRKIVADWDWRRFKPPIVAASAEGLQVIDGQHTATAAASHPGVSRIPVMVVDADAVVSRAAAFVGHNKDRLQLTATQLHHAAIAAGDEDALTIEQVCGRSGVVMLKSQPGNGVFNARETMAVGAIGKLISKRGAMRARQILDVLAKADCAPIGAAQIKAVELLLTEPEYAEVLDPEDLTSTIMRLGEAAEQEAKVFAATHNVPQWRALAIVLFKRSRHGRRRQG